MGKTAIMRGAGFRLRRSVVILVAAAAAVFGWDSAAAENTVTGTVAFDKRVVLPPQSVLDVSLHDVSHADARSFELAGILIEDPGLPPYNFGLAYDGEAIDPRHTYVVRASIRTDGRLLFTTDTVYPVLTRGAGNEVNLVLRRVSDGPSSEMPTTLGNLPASFEGELPCADCPGMFFHLDLFEDHVFFLRTTYLGRGAEAIRDAIGSWIMAGDDGRLTLFGGTEVPVFFRVINSDTLRKLDVEGRDIESSLNYELRRLDEAEPIEIRLRMRGMYSYLADAALFQECLSGRRFQVAQEADNIALERAYLKAKSQPGEALKVSLLGRIAERPAMEGGAMVLTVVPERFIGVWPGETCGARMVTADLESTYWKLTRLGSEPVYLGDQQREPHMVLRSKDSVVTGFSGCNRLTGSYVLNGHSIEFSGLASAMMACTESAKTERAFISALGDARSWRVIGEHLDLYDGDGNLVARFEARNLE